MGIDLQMRRGWRVDGRSKGIGEQAGKRPDTGVGADASEYRAALEMDYASALTREAEAQKIAGESADAREGGIAFLQKRKAEFKGNSIHFSRLRHPELVSG